MAKRGNMGLDRLGYSRKSQLTAFILIGIVVLAIFGFMIAYSSSMKKTQIEKQIDIATEKIAETNILKQYVTLCLKDSLQQGLAIAGKQGGIIGIIGEPPEYVEYEGYNVNYGIKEILGFPTSELPGPPEYPCINKAGTLSYPCSTPYSKLKPDKPYVFGAKNLPALCDPNGPNAADLEIFPFPCPTGTYGPNSIQEQLDSFVEAKLAECLGEESMTSIDEVTKLKITAGMPNVSVVFGEEEVSAKAVYPLSMSIGKYTSTKLFDFQADVPVRMKKLFGLADCLARGEISYLGFNATRDFNSCKYFGKDIVPAMNVTRYRILQDTEGTDIIEIDDPVSVIKGRQYIFRFAVQNRIPALDLIPDRGVTEGDKIFEGQIISINAQAYDPDDNDVLVYSVAGWKGGEWSINSNHISYSTQDGDAGSHTITVKACDEAGECDWQENIDIEIEVRSTI